MTKETLTAANDLVKKIEYLKSHIEYVQDVTKKHMPDTMKLVLEIKGITNGGFTFFEGYTPQFQIDKFIEEYTQNLEHALAELERQLDRL
jgi:hypothetical protein